MRKNLMTYPDKELSELPQIIFGFPRVQVSTETKLSLKHLFIQKKCLKKKRLSTGFN